MTAAEREEATIIAFVLAIGLCVVIGATLLAVKMTASDVVVEEEIDITVEEIVVPAEAMPQAGH